MSTKHRVFVVKVCLKNNKRIWRRIAIRGDQTLDDLHEAIFDAFDRDDEHLYSFYFLNPGERGRDRMKGAKEYTHPFNAKKSKGMLGFPLPDASQAKIAALPLAKGSKFEYLFDFGDSWWHELTVESTDGVPDDRPYPRVVEAKGKSPPQYPDLEDEEDYEDEE
jgi:hypothetical protein